METEKKYTGYGCHGGGRKQKNPEEKIVYKNITKDEIIDMFDSSKGLF